MASPPSEPWVSFVHPALSALGLALCWLTLRAGLAVRDARRKGQPSLQARHLAHLRLARPSVGLVVASFPMGLGTAVLAREMAPLATAHGWLATGTTVALLLAAVAGWRLGKAPAGARGPHVGLGLLGLLLGLITALTGIELLP